MAMGTTVLGPCTPELEATLAERRRLGQDRHDEVWAGEYHMVPGLHSRHGRADLVTMLALHPFAARAGLAGAKFGFFAAHGVDEVVVVEPTTREVEWCALADGDYHRVEHSEILGVDVAVIVASMDW